MKCDVFLVMILGNLSFYIGVAFCFGSTTEFMVFPFAFEIGAAMVGFGDAATMNLCIRWVKLNPTMVKLNPTMKRSFKDLASQNVFS